MSKCKPLPCGYKWWTGETECSICNHVQVSVIAIEESYDEPIVSLECGECHNMTSHPVEDEDE